MERIVKLIQDFMTSDYSALKEKMFCVLSVISSFAPK